MTLEEIDPSDPRWSFEASIVFRQLFTQVEKYVNERRFREAHGVRKSILITANVLIECDNRVTHFQPL